MKRLHTLAKVTLFVNGGLLAAVAATFWLRPDVSGGSALDIPAFLLGHYCVFLLPLTTLAAVVILYRRSPLRLVGALFLTVGLLFLLANYSLLVPGIRVRTAVYDSEGNARLDDTGRPMTEVNPDYLAFRRAQFHRTLAASIISGIGAAILLADSLRRRPQNSVETIASRRE
jgi:hypothetical protein